LPAKWATHDSSGSETNHRKKMSIKADDLSAGATTRTVKAFCYIGKKHVDGNTQGNARSVNLLRKRMPFEASQFYSPSRTETYLHSQRTSIAKRFRRGYTAIPSSFHSRLKRYRGASNARKCQPHSRTTRRIDILRCRGSQSDTQFLCSSSSVPVLRSSRTSQPRTLDATGTVAALSNTINWRGPKL
jgi:hypothetical protein